MHVLQPSIGPLVARQIPRTPRLARDLFFNTRRLLGLELALEPIGFAPLPERARVALGFAVRQPLPARLALRKNRRAPLLRRLRDEAHRFAVSFHRQQRGERMKRARLSDIPGVGPKRVKDLLAHFNSIDAIQLASIETLSKAPGVGPALARDIHDFFHPSDEGTDADARAALEEQPKELSA